MNETKESNITKVNNLDLELDMLWYINELLEFIEDKDITFRDALFENILRFNDEYCKIACEAIEALRDEGYIEGDISISYEGEYTGKAEDYNKLAYSVCYFEDIKVTSKGKEALNKSKTMIKLERAMEEIKKSVMRGGKVIVEEGEKAMPAILMQILLALASNRIHK